MSTAVLISGGVDSSVALMRLAEKGEPALRAFYLKIWLEDEMAFLGSCPWDEDLRLARAVCAQAGVTLEVLPLQRQYFELVVAAAVAELEAGRTPSPDILCNRRIKLGSFLDHVGGSFDHVATGHHARLRREAGLTRLVKGADPVKDQTYFLCRLDQQQLSRCRFPVGDLQKSEIRRLARQWSLPNAERPDSQGICFLGRIPYDAFVEFHLGERRGEIREHNSGRRLGEHRGYWFFTIGQRRGLGLAGGPWYVVDKEVQSNTVWVTHARNLAEHRRHRFRIVHPHWIASPPRRADLDVRIRHGERLAACRLTEDKTGAVEVFLHTPDPGVAPGQYAVLYDGNECIGGGVISWRSRELEED